MRGFFGSEIVDRSVDIYRSSNVIRNLKGGTNMNTKALIREVVESHNLMHIATIDSDGMPCLRGVDYVVGDCENILYFVTRKDSRKVQQIKNNVRKRRLDNCVNRHAWRKTISII